MNFKIIYDLNKKIIVIILFVFLLSLVILNSKILGLGVNESFFLFKYGIRRSQLFVFLIVSLIVLVGKFIIRKTILNNLEIFRYKLENLYFILLLILGIIKTLFVKQEYSTFHWNNIGDLVLSYKIIKPDILNNDFITLSNYSSPKIIFAYIISIFNKIGFEPLLFCEYLDLLVQIFSLPLIFFLIIKIVNFNTINKKGNFKFYLFCIFIFESFTYTLQEKLTLAGFRPFFDFESISYSTDLSLFIGLTFLLLYKEKRNFLNIFLFSFSVLINPLIGIFIFIIWIISFFSFDKSLKQSVIFIFIIGIISVSVKLIFQKEVISDNDFIKIYIYERHSHHYLLSKIIDFRIIILFISFAIPAFFSRKSKWENFHLKSIIVFFSALIIHYVFIEILPTKLFSTLTLSRFSIFCLLLLLISYCIFLSDLDSSTRKNINSSRILNFNIKINLNRIKKSIYIILSLIICFMIVEIPEKRFRKILSETCPDYYSFKSWINENTTKKDVFQVFPSDIKLNFFVRIFAERNIYWGTEFTFNEKDFYKWRERRLLYNEVFNNKNLKLKESILNEIDYVIVKRSKIIEKLNNKALVEFKNFYIFDSNEFSKVIDK